MATEKRQTPKQSIEVEEKETSANTLDIFRDSFTFELNGVKLKGRIMTLEDTLDLQDEFPEWQSDDPSELLGITENEDKEKSNLRIRFIQSLLNRFVGEPNGFDSRQVNRLFNYSRMTEMTEVLQKILGTYTEDTAGNGQADAAASNTSKPTGAISSPSLPNTTNLPSEKSNN